MTMADRVAVMNGGRLVQVDTPRAVYERPADAFTAAFVGVMNLLDGWTVGAGNTLERGGLVLLADAPPVPPGGRVTVAFRPEEATLGARGVGGGETRDNVVPCRVDRVEFRGAFVRYYVTVPGGSETVLVDAPARDAAWAEGRGGAAGELHVRPECVRAFASAGAPR